MSSRKGVGIGAFDQSRLTTAHYVNHGSSLRSMNTQALEAQIAVLKSSLHQFASTHAKDIKSDPGFRAQFARMCNAIGVDPLASSSHAAARSGGDSIWAQLLGGSVNDFYFELAVRVVEICGQTRDENGGLISIREVCHRMMAGRLGHGLADISLDDISRAVDTLQPLGTAYTIVTMGSTSYIRSVSRQFNTDQSAVLEAAQVLGFVSIPMLVDNLSWNQARARTAIEDLLGEGLLWVDKAIFEWEYWSPASIVNMPTTGSDYRYV